MAQTRSWAIVAAGLLGVFFGFLLSLEALTDPGSASGEGGTNLSELILGVALLLVGLALIVASVRRLRSSTRPDEEL